MTVIIVTTFLFGMAIASYGSQGQKELPGITAAQQGMIVSGTVTSAIDNQSLPGATIIVKGTSTGVISDSEGKYSITVPNAQSVLVFSFIGMEIQEIQVNGKVTINVALAFTTIGVEEVVVTALGITRKEKSLGFAIGKVSGDDMSRVVQENALNGLSGKVSGVQISSTGGTGASVSMVIRGATSLSSDNQPLFVIDGVPVINTLNNVAGFGYDNRVDYGNAISDLNSSDIESVSVLKGASAAALYGSRAGNGVVLITTKSGSKNKGITVTINTNTVFDNPYKYFETSKQFASGNFSFTPEDLPPGTVMRVPGNEPPAGIELNKGYFAVQWNSPKDANGVQIPTELVRHDNNIANFVQTGISTTNGASVSSNNDNGSFRIGATNMTSKGIIPNSDLNRNNLIASSIFKVRDNITVSSNINITRSWADNRPAGNRGTNPLQFAYYTPNNTDIRDLKQYWEPGKEGLVQRTYAPGDSENPYFLAYEVNNSFNRDRIFGNLKADWQLTKELSLMGRYSLDRFTEVRESKISAGYTAEVNGAYGIQNITNYERNIDVLATYAKQLQDFSISASAGGNLLYKYGASISNSSASGAGLIVPNVYTVGNIKSGALNYSNGWSQKAIYSAYGIANLGWKNMVFLDLTARNDWSSTLPKANQSYFYPSASLSLLVNEMVHLGDQVSLFKIRGGWAMAGNDTDPYQLYNTYGNAGQWGDATRLAKPGQILSPNLKPEEITSKEGGIDLGFFQNRLKFEGTYYEVQNRNQILRNIPVASSTGSDVVNINAGLIESKGWELAVSGTPIKTKDWNWNISTNWSKNETRLVEIAPGIDVLKFWSDAKGGAWSYKGDVIGAIYDAAILTVTDQNSPYYGYPIIDPGELAQTPIESEVAKNKIGNFNPNFMMGMQTSLSYKGFTLNMSFDWRSGGQFISQTQRYIGTSQRWLDQLINPGGRTGKELRDWLVANEDIYIKNGFHNVGGPTAAYGGFRENYSGTYVSDGTFVPGVVAVPDGKGGVTYIEHLGENMPLPYMPYIGSMPWNFTKVSMFDADFVKLREISLSYKVPQSFLNRIGGIQNLTVAVYSRNIMLWTKAKMGIDPERAFEQGDGGDSRGMNFKQGIERYNLEPWVIPVGFKLDLTF